MAPFRSENPLSSGERRRGGADGDGQDPPRGAGEGQAFSVTPHAVSFLGPLTRATLPDLWPQLLSAARNFRHGAGALRFDFSRAGEVDGAGVAALARLLREARAAGRAPETVRSGGKGRAR